jgi:hypothetical protein
MFGCFLVLGWGGNGHDPVVAVAAHRADQFLLGNQFQDAAQIADEPLLAGDGAGLALDLVLVVVHQNDAVGVGGNLPEIVVGGQDLGVDVQPQIARVQVGIESLQEAHIRRAGFVGQVFDVQREAAIGRKGGKESAKSAGAAAALLS